MTRARTQARPDQLPRPFGWPALALGLLFTGGPLVVIVAFSFMTQPDMGGGVVFRFSAQAYKNFLVATDFVGRTAFDPTYLNILGISLLQALVTTVACIAMAFPLALWMSMQPPRRQRVLVLLVTIPFWTNLLVRTYAWQLLLADRGVVNSAAHFMGLGPVTLLNTQFASVIGLIYTFLPFMVLPIYSALANFDFRLAEAAYDLGARKSTVIRRVVYPAAKGGVVSGVLLVFIPAFGSYVQPVLLGGGKVQMIGSLIANQFGQARNWPFGAALSVVILVVLLLGLTAGALWSRRTGGKVDLAL